jgi:germination protein M
VVESPVPGATVRSPLPVRGTADVFEATFRAELVDSVGRVIAAAQVHASSGTGTRGTFDFTLTFTTAPGPASLRVFDLSPKDGSRQDLMSIPLHLTE